MKFLNREYGVDFYRASGVGRVAVHLTDFLSDQEQKDYESIPELMSKIAAERAAKCGFKRSRVLDIFTIKATNLIKVGRAIWWAISESQISTK